MLSTILNDMWKYEYKLLILIIIILIYEPSFITCI